MKNKPMNAADLESMVGAAITSAIEHTNEDVVDDRLKAQRYFRGEVDIGHEEGRSQVVATKCRDVVRQVKPSLLRVFLSSDKPVEFIPRNNDDVQAAEQATKYVRWKFGEQNGYRVLSDVFHDALVKKVGIAKAYFEEIEDAKIVEQRGLSELEYIALTAIDAVDIVEHDEEDNGTHTVKLSVKRSDGQIRILSIPPEDFFIDDNATSIDDFTICGHVAERPIADLVAMGIPYEDVKDLSEKEEDEEEQERDNHRDDEDIHVDPMMRVVKVTEAYMRVDAEGTGKPQLYCFLMGGTKYKLLRKDVVDETPFAVFEVDPEPHTFYGRSLVDILTSEQDAATSMLRGVIDNVSLVNNPGTLAVEDQVEMEDLLNNEVGRIVRIKQQGAVAPEVVPFVAGSTIPFLQYFDESLEVKTGVSRVSVGLDPNALQNATATAVNAAVNGGNSQIEVMARNLAEGGVKRLFQLLLRLTVQHMPQEAMMRLNGTYVQVQPDQWDATMDMAVNVGLGSGQEDMKIAALQATYQNQKEIYMAGGPNNGLVTLTGMRNTLADILIQANVRNPDRYYEPMTPEREQQLMAAAQQNQQQQPDQNAAFLQSEQMKAEQRMAEAQMKTQADMQQASAELDLERDRMLQDLALKAADLIGKYGVGPQVAQILQQQRQN